MYSTISYTRSNRITTILLNRPEKRNALNFQIVQELKSLFSSLSDDLETKVIILKGSGEVFCAGADLAYLKELQQNSFDENLTDSNHLKELFEIIYRLKKVVIAEVHGAAIAGGCGLAVVSDVVFCSPEAKFGFTEVGIGFIPAIVSIFALRKMGESRARELLLSGRLIDSREAQISGVVNFVVESDQLSSEVYSYAERLVSRTSGSSLSLTKELIAAVQDETLQNSLDLAARMNASARSTDDCKRGIAAFLNKEKIVW